MSSVADIIFNQNPKIWYICQLAVVNHNFRAVKNAMLCKRTSYKTKFRLDSLIKTGISSSAVTLKVAIKIL